MSQPSYKVNDRVEVYNDAHKFCSFGTVARIYRMKEDQSYLGYSWFPEIVEVITDNGMTITDYDITYKFYPVKTQN